MLWILYTYENNRIEGNTLTLEETANGRPDCGDSCFVVISVYYGLKKKRITLVV